LRVWPLRFSHPPRRGEAYVSSFILPWASLCSKVLPGPGRLLRGILSWGFPPLQRATPGSDLHRVHQTRLCCVFRLSQPLDAFFLPEPSGLVSCQWRSWGSDLQRFILPVRQVHISVTLPLLAFLSMPGVATLHPSAGLSESHDRQPESQGHMVSLRGTGGPTGNSAGLEVRLSGERLFAALLEPILSWVSSPPGISLFLP